MGFFDRLRRDPVSDSDRMVLNGVRGASAVLNGVIERCLGMENFQNDARVLEDVALADQLLSDVAVTLNPKTNPAVRRLWLGMSGFQSAVHNAVVRGDRGTLEEFRSHGADTEEPF